MVNPIVERVIAAKGNTTLADELIRDYLPFIKSEVAKTAPESDGDELSIAMIAFHEAINSYQSDRGAFLSFAALMIRNRLIDFYRKEARHRQTMSLQIPLDDDRILEDTLEDPNNPSQARESQTATAAEIIELVAQLQEFGLSLTDISDDSPKQDRTLQQCQLVVDYARRNPDIIQELLRTKKLPITALVKGSGAPKKILERHRKYLMALLIIFSNGYEIIRNHVGLTFKKEGGVQA